MRKIYSLLLLGGLLLLGAQNADADTWKLVGNWNYNGAWVTDGSVQFDVDGTSGWLTLNLVGGRDYAFRVRKNDVTDYGYNNGIITSNNNTNWKLYTNNNEDIVIRTVNSGLYLIKIHWDGSDPLVDVYYPSSESYTFTIEFDKAGNDWEHLYAFVSRDDRGSGNAFIKPLGNWPGKEVTDDNSDGIYSLTFSTTYAPYVIYWHDNNGNQVGSFDFGNYRYKTDGTITKKITPTPGDYYATFFSPTMKFELPANVTAYTAAYNSSASTLTLTAFDGENSTVIPANTPVILKYNAGTDFTVTKTTEDAYDLGSTTNDLIGSDGTAAATASTYVLGHQGTPAVTAFYNYSSGVVPANKAYFVKPGEGAPSIFFAIDEENNATNIENVKVNEHTVKFIKNGQLFIQKDDVVYDVTGRTVK